MTEYTYKDVIIDPEDPRVEIGAKYWVGKTPTEVLLNARAEAVTIILSYVDETLFAPFVASALDGEGFSCLIRKKEPEKKYVPFDLSKEEDRSFLKGRWIKTDGDEEQITGFERDDDGVWHIKISADYLLSEDMLNLWKFDDGLPCGVLVEEDE